MTGMQPFDAVVSLESDERLDPLVSPLRDAVQKLLPPGRVRDVLQGVWLGHPVHPTLVQVSLGAFLSASVLDALPGNENASTALVATGLVSVTPAAVTGWADWSELHEQQQRVGLVHAAANLSGVALYGLSLTSRLRGAHGTGRALGMAGLGLLSLGGFLGGHLSFRQASGANHAEEVPHLVQPGWQDVCALDDLPEGSMQRRLLGDDNGDVPLLVLRRGAAVTVLSDRCSHLSGPLHEGELTDGARCVVCPWHGSVFRLDDGSVAHGPATAPVPSFETLVTDGRVQVRLPGAG
jgi:nitrite reductase/ring-hydroxylating ferredoxin subunit